MRSTPGVQLVKRDVLGITDPLVLYFKYKRCSPSGIYRVMRISTRPDFHQAERSRVIALQGFDPRSQARRARNTRPASAIL